MPRVSTKKSVASKSSAIENPTDSTEKVLIENFVSLQKVMTNLSMKFDELSKQISKLLELFEISAKSIAGKGFDPDKIEKKVDNLLEQNKIIARGLTLVHEKQNPQTTEESARPTERPAFPPRFKPLSKR